jgi:hypothetical protein
MTTQTIPQIEPFNEAQFFEVLAAGPVTPGEIATAIGEERDLVQEYLEQYTRLECLVYDAETGRSWNCCPWPRTGA